MNKTLIWSVKAKKDLKAIKDFYNHRNQSSIYSNKLLKELRATAVLFCKYPEVAITTDYNQVKGFVILDYFLFYRIFESHILILTVWDSRRNPDALLAVLNS
ncbi:MAG: type II toxin-antitoxin system RelE/ParE family toxin [Sphingobacteriaceae bacterium]|nr:MAG: type II toxin-antitoxin system RelE/ParE family toxin [Sphingobacteriaceae bacterium]